MFGKQQILDEIKRTAAESGGVAPGRAVFARETGIKESDWSGKCWSRWSDVLVEAGLPPNQMQGRMADEIIVTALIGEIR